jgi:diaminopimelate epimerase
VDAVRDGSKIRDLYLTGPTNIVAKGEITDEELSI